MKKGYIVFICLFIIIEGIFVFVIMNMDDNKGLEVKENNKIDTKIAVMLESGDTYVESQYGAIPGAGYKLNTELTMCVDKNGNKTDSTINYVNNEINVETTKSVSCYLYFDIDK